MFMLTIEIVIINVCISKLNEVYKILNLTSGKRSFTGKITTIRLIYEIFIAT